MSDIPVRGAAHMVPTGPSVTRMKNVRAWWDFKHSNPDHGVSIAEMWVTGTLAQRESMGMVTIRGEHTKHVDHGWIIRYVLQVNGIKLAEKWIKSNKHGDAGAALMDAVAEIGPLKKTIYKASYKRGYQPPTLGEKP